MKHRIAYIVTHTEQPLDKTTIQNIKSIGGVNHLAIVDFVFEHEIAMSNALHLALYQIGADSVIIQHEDAYHIYHKEERNVIILPYDLKKLKDYLLSLLHPSIIATEEYWNHSAISTKLSS